MKIDKHILQIKNWVQSIVIDLGFCPYAKPVFESNRIEYKSYPGNNHKELIEEFFLLIKRIDKEESIETALLIVPNYLLEFDSYIDTLQEIEDYLDELEYTGVYQLASFHPDYIFAGSTNEDPANYTNRSPYPCFHILRESSISKVTNEGTDHLAIPNRNIKLAQNKGIEFMRLLLESSFNTSSDKV